MKYIASLLPLASLVAGDAVEVKFVPSSNPYPQLSKLLASGSALFEQDVDKYTKMIQSSFSQEMQKTRNIGLTQTGAGDVSVNVLAGAQPSPKVLRRVSELLNYRRARFHAFAQQAMTDLQEITKKYAKTNFVELPGSQTIRFSTGGQRYPTVSDVVQSAHARFDQIESQFYTTLLKLSSSLVSTHETSFLPVQASAPGAARDAELANTGYSVDVHPPQEDDSDILDSIDLIARIEKEKGFITMKTYEADRKRILG